MAIWRILLFTLALGVAPGLRGEHSFSSSDGQRNFVGTLMAYEEATQMTTVRMKNGRTINFKIDLLSEEDQAYVRSRGTSLQIANKVRVAVKKESGESKEVKSRGLTCIEDKEAFNVSLTNTGPNDLTDVEVHYWAHWTDDEGGEGETAKVEQGTEVLSSLPANRKPVSFQTPMISLVKRTPETVISGPT